MVRHGVPRRKAGRRGRRERPRSQRGPLLSPCGQLLLHGREDGAARRGQGRHLSPRPALLSCRLRATLPRDRISGRSLRGRRPASLLHEGPRGYGQGADGGRLRRARQLQGDERPLLRPRVRAQGISHAIGGRAGAGRGHSPARHPLSPRLRGPGPGRARLPQAARQTSTSGTSSSWATASAATARRASPVSSKTMPAASPSGRCTGT